jgi:hypothetical protein
MLVRQCFDMQDTYGLRPEQLANRMRGIIEDTQGYSLAIIHKAFVEWRRTSPKIPTPYDIRTLCEKHRLLAFKGMKRFSDFDNDYIKYKNYIDSLNGE